VGGGWGLCWLISPWQLGLGMPGDAVFAKRCVPGGLQLIYAHDMHTAQAPTWPERQCALTVCA
jgi:hypothetical protein